VYKMAQSDIGPAFHVDYLRKLPQTPLCAVSKMQMMVGSGCDLVPKPEEPSAPVETTIETGGTVGNSGVIYRVPADIWFHIFYTGTHIDGKDGGNFPVVISHVCRFWREIALGSPMLWTNIYISSVSINSLIRHGGPVMPRASTFVARSGQCSLVVKLDLARRRPGDIPDETVSMYLRLLSSTAVDLLVIAHDRIKSLDIATDLKEISFWISHKVVPLGMPRLESWKMCRGDPTNPVNLSSSTNHYRGFIEFDAAGARGGSFESSTDTIGDRLPRLKHLQMSQIVANWSLWSIGGLTTLTINHLALGNRPSISDLRDILARSNHSLESLELHGSLPVRPFEHPVSITLPKLRHLRLGYWTQEEALVLLPHLDMPALKSLALCDISGCVHEYRRRMIGRAGYATDVPLDLTFYGIPAYEDLDSAQLLEALCITHAPLLRQLDSVELTRVQALSFLVGPPRDWIDEAFPRHQVYLARFLLSMPSLRTLTLDGPDAGFLHCLNHPYKVTVGQPESPGGVERHIVYPCAQLPTLRIFDCEYDDLVDFFFNRAELAGDPTARRGFPVFDTLEFALDKIELELFKSECPSVDGGFNISTFAKTTVCRIYNDISCRKVPFI